MTETFEQRLEQMKLRFRARAAAEAIVLQTIVSDLDNGAPASPLRADIKRIAHRLAGAAGTFGFAGISSGAIDLETLASDGCESDRLAAACCRLVQDITQAA